MATAIDVTKYIKSRMTPMGELQLQKLAYYAQAWALAWDGRPLFSERIEAWKMGPVVPALRYRTDEADSSVLTDEERATVDAVIEFYGKHHGGALATMTHGEQPWLDARGDLPVSAWCNNEITHESMRRFYTRQVIAGAEAPKRRSIPKTAQDGEVGTVARANAERWRGTLDLLAR